MSERNDIRYFLGANTSEGFYSLYEDHCEQADYVWYIKGGPGNGKSTFMRRIGEAAEDAGYTAEYAMCSGDPDSVDGIRIREKRIAYVDATSPHVLEPTLPGAGGRYIDLSVFYKKNAVYDKSAIRECFRRYRAEYERAYALLKAAALSESGAIPGLITEEARGAVRDAAREKVRELPAGDGGEKRRVFLSAYTCKGFVRFTGLLSDYTVYVLHSSVGLEACFLQEMETICQEKGLSVIVCCDPLEPGVNEGVILPALRLAYIKKSKGCGPSGRSAEDLFLDCFIPEEQRTIRASEIRKTASLRSSLLRRAEESLRNAKMIHDELEALYHPAVDFKALDRLTEKHIREYIK